MASLGAGSGAGPLLLCGGTAGRVRKGIDDLTGARVVQLFARLVLDGVGVALQVVYVLVQSLVFLLELQHLLLKLFCLFPLVGIGRQTVMTEDDAVRHHEGESGGRDGRSSPPPQVDAVLGRSSEFGELGGEPRFLWGDSQLRASVDSSEFLSVQKEYRAFRGENERGSSGRNQTRRQGETERSS
jgi:hypothetical protein